MLGQNGLYTQESNLDKWPDLAGWRGLGNPQANAAFNKTCVAFVDSWGPTSPILDDLQFGYTADFLGDSADVVIAEKLEGSEPLLFYLWSPHALLSKFKLNRIQLKAYTTRADFDAGKCDFPPDTLEKVYAKTLTKSMPLVERLYQRFSVRAGSVSWILDQVRPGLDLAGAVCAWMKDAENNGTWAEWVPVEEVSCKPGEHKDADDTCKPCAPGYFSEGGTVQSCSPCPAGEFQPDPGNAKCISCDILGDFFQNQTGSTKCIPCPSNTQRFIGRGSGAFASSCMCKAGDAPSPIPNTVNVCPNQHANLLALATPFCAIQGRGGTMGCSGDLAFLVPKAASARARISFHTPLRNIGQPPATTHWRFLPKTGQALTFWMTTRRTSYTANRGSV